MSKQEIITCPSCGSQKTNMRTPIAGTIFIILGGLILVDFAVTRKLDIAALPGCVVLLILGLMFWYGNRRAMCTECNHKFRITDDLKLTIRCPKCNRKLKGATEDMVGDIGVCSKCKTEFEIKRK